jgi:membrane-bound lytic murein transglycosylase D
MKALLLLVIVGASAGLRAEENLAGPMVSTSPFSDAEGTPLEAPGEDVSLLPAPPPRPDWAMKADALLAESAAAKALGDPRAARRATARAFKIFIEKADDAVLEAAGERLAPLWGTASPPAAGGEVDGALPTTTIVPTLLGGPTDAGGAHSYQFTLPLDDPLVLKYVALYKGPLKERTQAALDRMALHQEMILKAIRAEGLPEELLFLPIVESEYQPFAVSRAGAVGMWQFMPTTARYAGLKVNYWIDERRDPVKSTKAALKVLKSLFEWFDDWSLALAAYNRGMYGIQRDLEFTRSADFNALSKRQGIPKETEHYVPKMMAISLIAQDFKAHGLRPPDPRRRSPPDEVVLEKPLDLKVAAAAAKTTEDVIRELNPSVRLWCTPQNETQFLFRVPTGTKDRFLEALAQVKDWTPSPGMVKYKVQKGDVLGRVAQRYRTTAAAIQRDNKLTNPHRVRPGQVLVIRPGRGFKGD